MIYAFGIALALSLGWVLNLRRQLHKQEMANDDLANANDALSTLLRGRDEDLRSCRRQILADGLRMYRKRDASGRFIKSSAIMEP